MFWEIDALITLFCSCAIRSCWPSTGFSNWGDANRISATCKLLDLGFLELNVLAHDRIVLLEAEFLRARARILLRHVKVAGAGRRKQFDLLSDGLCHGCRSLRVWLGQCAWRATYLVAGWCQAAATG